MTTDTSEKGLERLICEALTGAPCDPTQGGMVRERPASYGAGWVQGDPHDYDREYCVDLATGKLDEREAAARLPEETNGLGLVGEDGMSAGNADGKCNRRKGYD